MKKFLALLMAVIMVLTVSITAFATPGSFVQSPSNNNGPELVEGSNEDEECTAELIITPYKDRATLPAKALADIEKVYGIIAAGVDLTSLNAEFKAFVASKGLLASNLAVSDLFDVSYYNCDIHDFHGYFRIKLSADTLRNFVGLLHYNDGVWEFVDNAKVLPDGETLEFSIKDLSPFAIVVDTSKGSAVSPETGAEDYTAFVAVITSIAAASVVFVSLKKKKYE
ncbi:MAG: hypothetical protein IJZ57_07540 [Clostridia bacterium]|nr:hypothetical protein [Clostridia bacterium]